jgi:radical SAM superfamily enzyme YgiQ (UPF0313 family)
MRVLLVSANRTQQPVPVFPFGACLVAQASQRAGHSVRFLDLMFQKDFARALTSELNQHPPDVVGLSVRNIDTNDVGNPLALADEAAEITRVIGRHSRAPVVLGGAALGVMPQQLLQRTGAAWAVASDGETVFPRLLDALSCGKDPAAIDGVLCQRTARDPQGPRTQHPLTDCTVEDFSRWVDVPRYLSRMAAVPVQTKRGCPFECVYCTYNLAEGRNYRLHPPEEVVGAIRRLAAEGFGDIEFVDNVFNSPYEHALAICQALAAERLPVRLQTLELNPRFLTDELLSAMEDAGFVGIGVTVESASDPVLAAIRKGYGAADVQRAATIVARHNIPCIWIFMLGGPGETQATVRQTLEFAGSRLRPTDSAFFQIGVRIYPGTQIDRLARDEGVLKDPPDQMLSPVFYVSPQVPLDWLRAELAAAARDHLNFIAGDALGLPLLQAVLRLSYWLGVRPPLWRFTPSVRRVLKWLRLYR